MCLWRVLWVYKVDEGVCCTLICCWDMCGEDEVEFYGFEIVCD